MALGLEEEIEVPRRYVGEHGRRPTHRCGHLFGVEMAEWRASRRPRDSRRRLPPYHADLPSLERPAGRVDHDARDAVTRREHHLEIGGALRHLPHHLGMVGVTTRTARRRPARGR
jgi:hypothetical protein